jgi:hypothetical protein
MLGLRRIFEHLQFKKRLTEDYEVVVRSSAIVFDQYFSNGYIMSNLASLGFSFCNDTPCFMDICPGTTTIEDALKLLADKGAIKTSVARHNVYFDTRLMSVKVAIMPDNPVVIGLELSPNESIITLSQFVALYGEPCAVYAAPANPPSPHIEGIQFEYPLIRVLCQQIKDNNVPIANAPITHLLLASSYLIYRGMTPNACDQVNDPQQHCTTWHGFLSLNEYRRLVW